MDPLLRIVDVNANRAREALRVLEDLARFLLSRQDLCAGLKAVRHDLQAALAALPADALALLAWRDTQGDVGTAVSGALEGSRAGPADLAIAAGKRLGESLRSLEECAKALHPGPTWAAIEALRYRAYDLERDLLLALGAPGARQWSLCVLVSESLCRRPWREVAMAALAGGADCLQLREKSLPDGELLARARWLVNQAVPAGAALFINDRIDIALLSGAQGVHLGQEDLPIREARRLAGGRLLIGASTHDLAEARAAVEAGADVCGVGAMFPTPTKARATSGEAYLRAYLADPGLARVPHLAIGGISAANAGDLAAAGCRGIAVSGCVCGADDPAAMCRALRKALGRP